MPDFFFFINEVLWGSIMIYLLLGAGIWFTLRSGFIQFRYIRKFGRSLKNSVTPQPGGLTSFQALCTSLAARLGSGNLAGVALAISAGGPGAVFWMWVTALLGMATAFAESALAQLYKEKDKNGQFRGGPAWYMARGLGMRWMGVLFSLFLLLAYGLIFNTVQANSVAHALRYAFACPEWVAGSVLALVVLLTLSAGLKGIARLMQWLVPLIALIWIAASLLVAALHLDQVPGVIMTIVKSAFGWREVASGALGYTFSQALMAGFQRGMFSNEAGMGSTPNAAAAAASWPPHPAAQGIVQMIGVFTDTIIICSASAMILLLAGPVSHSSGTAGIQLLQQALVNLTGGWGAGFVSLILLLFAFSSIVVNYLYAENNLIFLKLDSRAAIGTLRLGVILMVVAGSLLSMPLVWQLADIIMALMAITNLTAILLLSPVVTLIAKDYLRQRKLGVPPVFDPARYPDIKAQLAPGTWDDLPRQ
ncbi:sodium:alanine symporter family protein [Enterobacter sichuanensis]|uniref:alanine/glycine:cation symporter family protein n=1 Tax=Enterobacter sichuanensis TaxID=2071710 RepID=UPI000BA8A6B4|nr:sodium:alanine symporter family protein [Enterobacter sichuanensis]MEB5962087.1 sodium:alanine symporter family protein [Enterobacter sichuanensis]PAN78023.1 sodium:alanine symporter family protein [Enterobacter cloacae]HED6269983.1 sodium:alanine symporter family protein [Enterobacter sichuanensis]HEM8744390.1 sodium:alanine symporter family protein [Enterobacter sichuanensis]